MGLKNTTAGATSVEMIFMGVQLLSPPHNSSPSNLIGSLLRRPLRRMVVIKEECKLTTTNYKLNKLRARRK